MIDTKSKNGINELCVFYNSFKINCKKTENIKRAVNCSICNDLKPNYIIFLLEDGTLDSLAIDFINKNEFKESGTTILNL